MLHTYVFFTAHDVTKSIPNNSTMFPSLLGVILRTIKEVYYHLCYVQYTKLDMSIINEGNKYSFQYLCEPAKNISEC